MDFTTTHLSIETARALCADAPAYHRLTTVRALRLTSPLTWRSSKGDELHAATGDWVLTSDDASEWTVKPDIFDVTYELVSPGRYRKVGVTRLLCMAEPFTVETLEGPSSGAAGDFLAMNEAFDAYPMPADFAVENYGAPSSSSAPAPTSE